MNKASAVSRCFPKANISCIDKIMSLFGSLKEFVEERLSVAAEDILGAFKKIINEYEEQIVCQQRLLVNVSKTQRTGE